MNQPGFWELLGLSEFDEQLYRRVLYAPGAQVQAHARALDCSETRVRRGVSRLVGLGLLRRTAGGIETIEPSIGLGALARRQRGVLDDAERIADELRQVFTSGRLHSDPQQRFEVLRGRAAIVGRIDDLLRGAQKSVVCTDTPPYVADQDPTLTAAERDVLDRGIAIRGLYDYSVLNDPLHVRNITEMAARGEEARIVSNLRIKLMVVDSDVALLAMASTPVYGEAHAVAVSHSALTAALCELFELMWANASPINFGNEQETPRGGARGLPRGLTADHKEVLDLLSAGMSDLAIARYLSISQRTLRRRIAQLQETLGANTRFQIATHAMKRGWI